MNTQLDPNNADTQLAKLIEAGFTAKEIQSYINQLAYRQQYNARPEVKEKRSLYNKRRNDRFAEMKSLLKGGR